MKRMPIKSQRGVYYDLSKSPYEVTTSKGFSLKFSSLKKMEIYQRELPIRIDKVQKAMEKANSITGLNLGVTEYIIKEIERRLYVEIEG